MARRSTRLPTMTGPSLRPSETPGVWLNTLNIPCNEAGVALSFMEVQEADQTRFYDVIGEPANSPAKLLKAVALDPRQTLGTRMDAAKAAAPYFDRRQPQGVDGGLDAAGSPLPLLDTSKLQALSTEELVVLRALLAKANLGLLP